MAVKISDAEAYKKSLQKLFPRGSYWDKQFSDPESDCSLFCKAKTDLLIRIRKRMLDLQNESVSLTANETLENWEMLLLGTINRGLDAAQRKTLLNSSKAGNINIEAIKEIGRIYGVIVTAVFFPFRPAFFGHSYFGINPIANPAAFSLLFIYASLPANENREAFEKQIISRTLSNYIIHFIYQYGGS